MQPILCPLLPFSFESFLYFVSNTNTYHKVFSYLSFILSKQFVDLLSHYKINIASPQNMHQGLSFRYLQGHLILLYDCFNPNLHLKTSWHFLTSLWYHFLTCPLTLLLRVPLRSTTSTINTLKDHLSCRKVKRNMKWKEGVIMQSMMLETPIYSYVFLCLPFGDWQIDQ